MTEQPGRDERRYYGPGGSVPWMKLSTELLQPGNPRHTEKPPSFVSETLTALRSLKQEIKNSFQIKPTDSHTD
ncbi:MAG: hypothetical protein WBB33_05355 [Candidatus Saccharimonadales bacterium]